MARFFDVHDNLIARRVTLRRDRWELVLKVAREQYANDLWAAIDAMLAVALPELMASAVRPVGPVPCRVCGAPATCFGAYEYAALSAFQATGAVEYGCDVHCGHGNEDGWCRPITEHE